MNQSNPLNSLAAAMYSACLVDLEPISYRHLTPGDKRRGLTTTDAPVKTRRPDPRDLERVEIWQQVWSSTALGFGGIGGAAMTTSDVVLIQGSMGDVCIYFSGRLAYHIRRPSEKFWSDAAAHRMVDVSEASEYETREQQLSP
jgi:hypothetical protein